MTRMQEKGIASEAALVTVDSWDHHQVFASRLIVAKHEAAHGRLEHGNSSVDIRCVSSIIDMCYRNVTNLEISPRGGAERQ